MADTVFSDSVEPARYPGTTVFVNLLNISSPKELAAKEAGFTVIRSIDFFNSRPRPAIDEAAINLASCLGIMNIYHPFPEGNGRTQRIFTSLLANVFQYSIDWDAVHAWEIVETSKCVHRRNYEPLEFLIKRIIFDKSQF